MERKDSESSEEATEGVTVLADLSSTGETPIPIKVQPDVFKRLEEILGKKGLTPQKVTAGVVVFGLAVGAGIAVKKIIDKKHQAEVTAPLTDEEFEKFKGLVEENYEPIFHYLRFRTYGSKEDAEDLSQRVFLRALTSYSRFKPQQGLENPEKSWLFRIAHNTSSNFLRDEGRKLHRIIEPKVDEDDSESSDRLLVDPILSSFHSIEGQVEETPEEVLRLRRILSEVPEHEKLLLYLKQKEELSNKEVGYVLGRSEGAIKSLYVRTLDRLREEFGKL